jgi:hypothetical protein
VIHARTKVCTDIIQGLTEEAEKSCTILFNSRSRSVLLRPSRVTSNWQTIHMVFALLDEPPHLLDDSCRCKHLEDRGEPGYGSIAHGTQRQTHICFLCTRLGSRSGQGIQHWRYLVPLYPNQMPLSTNRIASFSLISMEHAKSAWRCEPLLKMIGCPGSE